MISLSRVCQPLQLQYIYIFLFGPLREWNPKGGLHPRGREKKPVNQQRAKRGLVEEEVGQIVTGIQGRL